MSSRNVDVNLIIRAKSEADKVVGKLDAALQDLLGTEAKVGATSREMGARLAELAGFASELDRAFAATSSQGDKAAAAFERAADRAGKAVSDLANARENADSIRAGLSRLQSEADAAFVGPKRDGLSATIKALKTELKGADADVSRLSTEVGRLTGKLDGKIVGTSQLQEARSTLNAIGATINAIADAQAEAARQTDRTTEAIERQSAAARSGNRRGFDGSAAAQEGFNRRFSPGLSEGAARDNGATFEALTEQFTRLEAEAARVRATVDPVGAAIEAVEEKITRVQRLARDGFLSSDQAVARERQLREALAETTAELDGSAEATRRAKAEVESKAAADEKAARAAAASAEADRRRNEMEAEALRLRNEADAARVRASVDPVGTLNERFASDVSRLKDLQDAGAISAADMAAQEAILAERLRAATSELDGTAAAARDAAAATAAKTAADEKAAKAAEAVAESERKRIAAEAEATRARNDADAAKVRQSVNPIGTAQESYDGDIARLNELQRVGAITASDMAAQEAILADRLRQTIAELDGSAAATREASAATKRMDADATALRERLDPLAAIQSRFNEQLNRYRDLARAGKLSTDELAAAERHLTEEADKARAAVERGEQGGNGRGANGTPGLFGLRPYELQNLSYQINDIVTQLASGTSLTQTLAQQGGQVFQLFPQMAGTLLAAIKNPYIIAFVATVATLALGFKKASEEAERLRQITSAMEFRTDSAGYDPKNIAEQTEGLEDLGAKAEDALASLKALLADDINPELMEQFTTAALNTAKVLGTNLPTATQQLADAFSQGYEAVAKLDDKLNFLTATERDHIRELFLQGNAEAGRTEALAAYSRQAEAAAGKQKGPWAEAAKSLGRAWDSLIGYVANSLPVRATILVFNELADAVKIVGDAIADVVGGDPAGKTGDAAKFARMSQLQDQIKELEGQVASYEASIAKRSPIAGTLNALVIQSKRQLDEARAELKRLEQSSPDTTNGDPNGTAAKQRTERLEDITLEEQLQTLRRRGQEGLNRADSARRAQLAGEAAFRAEIKASGDAIIAGRLREKAAAEETRQIDQQNDGARKKAQQEREGQIRQFEQRVIGAEGGAGKNPFSSAKGYGQFTESTFIDQFRKVFASQASALSRDQILALRSNEQVAKAIIDNYTRENAHFLEGFGAKVTAGNLYLAHFLGAGGAKAVLQAAGDTPVDQIIRRVDPRRANQVLSGNKGYLRTEGGKGRYRTADELETFIAGRVGETGQAQTAGQVAINDLLEDSKRKQDDFNAAIRQANEERQRGVDALVAERGLVGQALIDEQRRQAVAKALFDLQQRVEDANRSLKPGEATVVITPEQVAEVERLTGVLFDAQHAQERLNVSLKDRERPYQAYQEEADLLRQQAEYLRSIGETKAADVVDRQLTAVNAKIREAIDNLIAFYKALSPAERAQLGLVEKQLDNIIAKLEAARNQTQQWGKIAGVSAKEIAQAFASQLTNSITTFVQRVSEGKNVFKALAQGVREFAASFISSIAQMILQLLAYAAAVSILRALGVPVPTAAVGVHHAGGVAGAPGGSKRNVSPAWFAAAIRYHSGGIAGLRPNEVPAILEAGEEVLTTGDPRHRGNGGGASAGGQNGSVTVMNLTDPAQALEQALRTPAGERVFINHVADNKAAFRATLG